MAQIVFFDTEIQPESGKILDIGAIRGDGMQFHSHSVSSFSEFVKGHAFFCGHNIIAHDLKYMDAHISAAAPNYLAIDTLCLSPLLFPMRPYHALVKDDKLQSGSLNNTATNEEALRVMGLLLRSNIAARLIQSNSGFDLYNLAEFRYFVRQLGDERIPVINEAVWIRAITALCAAYKNSTALPVCLKLLETFASVNRTKYRTDLLEFIHESGFEDFIEDAKNTVLVSTMHKAKGREFDKVYLMLNRFDLHTDAAKRAVYVALTRAKEALSIHYYGTFMEGTRVPGAVYQQDSKLWPEPNEIVLHLGHKDVVLDFFKNKKARCLALRSGQCLTAEGAYLLCDGKRVVKLSQKCMEQLAGLAKKGYSIQSAQIRFIVAWRGDDDREEHAILLPTLYLVR